MAGWPRRLRLRPWSMVQPGGLFIYFLNFFAEANRNAATIMAVGKWGMGDASIDPIIRPPLYFSLLYITLYTFPLFPFSPMKL